MTVRIARAKALVAWAVAAPTEPVSASTADFDCEVRDGGRLDAPLAGRVKPKGEAGSGFGLWLAGQLCDLVQVRAFREHSVVRLHRLLQMENASAVGAAVQ